MFFFKLGHQNLQYCWQYNALSGNFMYHIKRELSSVCVLNLLMITILNCSNFSNTMYDHLWVNEELFLSGIRSSCKNKMEDYTTFGCNCCQAVFLCRTRMIRWCIVGLLWLICRRRKRLITRHIHRWCWHGRRFGWYVVSPVGDKQTELRTRESESRVYTLETWS